MNDPATGTERTDTSYLWRASKRGQRAHIQNPETERAYCQAENCSGGKPFDGRGTGIPDGRRLCRNCTDLASRDETNYREPDIRVLMGERLAEEGGAKSVVNVAFGQANTVAPKPPKWKRQTRPAHRPGSRKPKRSNVKYARPFDDDLPW